MSNVRGHVACTHSTHTSYTVIIPPVLFHASVPLPEVDRIGVTFSRRIWERNIDLLSPEIALVRRKRRPLEDAWSTV